MADTPRKLRWRQGPTTIRDLPTLDADLIVTGTLAEGEPPPNSDELVEVLGKPWLVSEWRLHASPQTRPRWLLKLIEPPKQD